MSEQLINFQERVRKLTSTAYGLVKKRKEGKAHNMDFWNYQAKMVWHDIQKELLTLHYLEVKAKAQGW